MNLKFITSILWTIFIIISSLISAKTVNKFSFFNIPYSDKIIHFIFYFILFLLWYNYTISIKYNYIHIQKRVILLLLVILFGILMELLQLSLTQTRTFEFSDIIINVIGSKTAFILFFPVYQSKIFGRFF